MGSRGHSSFRTTLGELVGVSVPMQRPMVAAAEWDNIFVADAAAEGPRLGESQMVRV